VTNPAFRIELQYQARPAPSTLYGGLTRGEAIVMFEPDDPQECPAIERHLGRVFIKTALHQYQSVDGRMSARIVRE
jgi:hypothetical protein